MSTASATVKGRNLISGRWLPANGASFESHNPARNAEIVGVFPASSPNLAHEAVSPAASAGPTCSTTSPRSSSARRTTWPN
jgi:acyl-CoA reductase-like NAD-dependent aldehyde dehydrogenase